MSPRTALVISGGGAKGAFAIGALDYILDNRNPHFDLVAGTSTGALIAPFVVAEQEGGVSYPPFSVAKNAYLTTTSEQFVKPRSLLDVARGAVSVFDTAPLQAMIDSLFDRELYGAVERAGQGGVQMFAVTVCLQTGEVVYFHTGPGATAPEGTRVEPVTSYAHLKQAMLASANQPILMPPVTIKDSAGRSFQYVDGGVREYASVRIAVANGAEEVYAIYLSPPPDQRSPYRGNYRHALPTQETAADPEKQSITERTLDLFLLDVFENDLAGVRRVNEALEYVAALRRRLGGLQVVINGQPATAQQLDALFDQPETNMPSPFRGRRPIVVHEVFPEKPLDVGSLHVDPARMEEMYQQGYETAKKVFEP